MIFFWSLTAKCEIEIKSKARENVRGHSGQGREREREVGVEGLVLSHQLERDWRRRFQFFLHLFESEIERVTKIV